MHRQVILTIELIMFSVITSVQAAEQVSDTNDLQTLQDYLRYALLNNAELKSKFHEWKAEVEQIPQAKSLPDPKFTYGYFIKEVETRVGPQKQRFEIMQTFPWFGVIEARTDQAAAKAKASYQRYQAKKLNLFRDVKFAFFEYVYLARAIDITGENLELVTYFEEIARQRYATSTASHPDIIRAQIEQAVLEDRLTSLKELRPAISTKLNSILNRPVSDELPWPKPPEYQPVSMDFEQLYAMIIQNNPNLQAMGHEIEAARYNEKLAKKKTYPDLSIGVSYIDTAHARASGMPVSDSGKDPVIGMISLNLPIWGNNYRAAERRALEQIYQKTSEKTQMKNTLAADAQQLLYEFSDSNRKIRLYKDVIIPKAKEMLIASQTGYKAGTIDSLSLIDAERTLLQYELFYERLISENSQKLAGLEMLTGTEISLQEREIAEKAK